MERLITETDGTYHGQTVYCPVNGWDCPYWGKGNICHMENPAKRCEDFSKTYGMFGITTMEEWEAI